MSACPRLFSCLHNASFIPQNLTLLLTHLSQNYCYCPINVTICIEPWPLSSTNYRKYYNIIILIITTGGKLYKFFSCGATQYMVLCVRMSVRCPLSVPRFTKIYSPNLCLGKSIVGNVVVWFVCLMTWSGIPH